MHLAASHQIGRRRVGLRIAAAAAVLALSAACGSSDSTNTSSAAPGAKTADVAFVIPFTGIAFMQHQQAGAEAAAAEDPRIKLRVVAGSKPDPAAEVKLFTDAIASGAKGVVVMPLAPPLFSRAFADADRKGIPLATVTIRQEPTSPGIYVGESEYDAVRPAMRYLADKIGSDAKGKVVLGICSKGTGILEERIDGAKRYLAEYLPNVQVVGPFEGAQEPGKSFAAWQSIVSSNPDALAFIGSCPFDGDSLVKLRKSNPNARWVAGTVGIGPEILASIRSGDLLFGTDEVEFARGYVAVKRVAAALLDGRKQLEPGWVDTGATLVTRENVDETEKRYNATGAEAVTLFKEFIDKGMKSAPQPYSALKPS